METLDCLGEEMVQKDVWNCAMEDHGALSVMTTGTTLMLKLCATSWALHEQVCHHHSSYSRISITKNGASTFKLA